MISTTWRLSSWTKNKKGCKGRKGKDKEKVVSKAQALHGLTSYLPTGTGT